LLFYLQSWARCCKWRAMGCVAGLQRSTEVQTSVLGRAQRCRASRYRLRAGNRRLRRVDS
jgi:hypothetical protein